MRWRRTRKDLDQARLAVVEGVAFPPEALERFVRAHPEVFPEDAGLVEAATRQWFRLHVTIPGESLALPSRAVGDLWLELTREEFAYDEFCRSAFGRRLPHHPPPTTAGEGVAGGPDLARTLAAARRDEPDAPDRVPSLFRVDSVVGVLNGRRYLPGCGGGAQCHPVGGMVCLLHLAGADGLVRGSHDLRARRGVPSVDDGGQGVRSRLSPFGPG
jgi:hypothetical protein